MLTKIKWMGLILFATTGVNGVFAQSNPVPAAPKPESHEVSGRGIASLKGTPMKLDGQWAYRFDPEDKNLADGWAQPLVAEGQTELPGTTDTRGIGPANSEKSEFHLSRAYKYRGAVWFEREVEIPPAWAGQAVTLEMERVQWESRVWVDGKPAGMQDSLSTPHFHDLTNMLTPGRHRLTLRIDLSLIHI